MYLANRLQAKAKRPAGLDPRHFLVLGEGYITRRPYRANRRLFEDTIRAGPNGDTKGPSVTINIEAHLHVSLHTVTPRNGRINRRDGIERNPFIPGIG
jgi:hypothetical protein